MSDVVGAGLGTAFNVLYEGLETLIIKNVMFTPLLKRIESKLDRLVPLLKDIEESNKKLGRPVEEQEELKIHLEEGIKLLPKCEETQWWSVAERNKYANRLTEWDESLQQHLEILKVQGIRDMKDVAARMKSIEDALGRIQLNRVIPTQLDCEPFCTVAELPPLVADGTFPTQWQSVHLPQVEVLVLNFKTVNNALPEFVQKIDKLKVLIC